MNTPIEQYIIDKVREKRIEKGITQEALSYKINRSHGFIGLVESPKRREKYNFNHINAIARVLGCSPKDFLPDKFLPDNY